MKAARRVRRAVRGNGTTATSSPRPGPTQLDDTSLTGDYTFTKANQYFVHKDEPYCICVARFPQGAPFHGALYGVSPDNVEDLKARLPLPAQVEFMPMDGGFTSVGFRIRA